MGIFVTPINVKFANLSNVPQTLLTAGEHTLLISSIKICNHGGEDLRFNLQIRNLSDEPSLITANLPIVCANNTNAAVGIYNTVDIIKLFGLLYLRFSAIDNVSESLICFSNGYSQKFDCIVSYTVLNETPII